MSDRKGGWIQTYTGRQFWPLDPRADDIDIVDIAHHLARLCRFSGAVENFYSVAEHSWRVAMLLQGWMCSREIVIAGLLHDAAEAYLVDVPQPIKAFMPQYIEAEHRIQRCIEERFRLACMSLEHHNVKDADIVMLATEKRDVMGPSTHSWGDLPEPDDEIIEPFGLARAEQKFTTLARRFGIG